MQFLPVLHQFVCISMVLKSPKPFRVVEEDRLEPEAPLVWSSLRTGLLEMNLECCRWQEHMAAFMGETENANTWRLWGKNGKLPSDRAPKANHEQWNRDWSILCHSCPGQMKYCKVQHQQLTLAWSISATSRARMKLTCFRDVSNTRHMLVTSHKNHSDACLWQPLWQTLAWCQIVSQLFLNASCGAIRCKNGLPQSYLSCFQNLYLTFGVKAESNTA